MKTLTRAFVASLCLIIGNSEQLFSQTTFYLKSTGGSALTAVANWGINTDGTGTAPVNFTTASQVFVITNVATATLTNTWTVSGTGSKVILGNVSYGPVILTISGSGRLTGTIDVSTALYGANTLSLQTVSIPVLGTLSSGSIVDYAGTVSQTVRAALYGNLTSSNTGARILANSGTIGVSGVFTPGTNVYTVTGSTVNFNGIATQTIPAFNYNRLTSSNTGTRILDNTGTIRIASVFTPGTNAYTFDGSTIEFNGTGTQTIPAFNYHNLSGSNTGARTLANSGTISIAGVFTPGTNTYTNTGSTIDFSGDDVQTIPVFNYNNLVSSNIGDRILDYNGTIGIRSVFTPGSNMYTKDGSTISYNGTGAQTIPVFDYFNLSAEGGNTKTAAGDLSVENTLAVASGVTMNMAAYTLSSPSLLTSGTGTLRTQNTDLLPLPEGIQWAMTVLYNGTNPQEIVAGNYTSLNGTGGNRTLSASGNTGISGIFTVGAGVYTTTGSTIEFNGSSTQTIPSFAYYNLVSTNTGDRILSATGSVRIAGSFTPGANAYTITGSLVNFNGIDPQVIPAFHYQRLTSSSTGDRTLDNTGTIYIDSIFTPGTNAYNVEGSSVNFSGSNAQTIPAFDYYNLASSNSGTRTLAATGTIGVAGTFIPASNAYTVTGSTINYNGSDVQTITGFSYNRLTSSNTGDRILDNTSTIYIAGLFTPGTNAYTNTGSTIEFNGSGTQTIPAFNYYHLNSSNTGARTLANSGSVGVAGNFNKGGNTYTITGSTISFNGSGTQTIPVFNYNHLSSSNTGDRILDNTGTIGIAGTFTTGSNNYTVTGSTIDLNGGAQSFPAFTFHNLTASNANTKTAAGAITVNGTLDIASGVTVNLSTYELTGASILTSGTGTLRTQNTGSTPVPAGRSWAMSVLYNGAGVQTIVEGNYAILNGTGGNRTLSNTGVIGVSTTFTAGAGTYTNTGSTIDFNGSGAQSIPAFNYYHLTSSNTGARTLAGSGTVGIAGAFTPGSNTYTNTGSTINFNGSSAQTIPAFSYNNLTSSSTGTRTLDNIGIIQIGRTFTKGTNTYTVTGSTVEFNGAAAQTIPVFTFHNLKASGAGLKTAGGTITIDNNLDIEPGATLTMSTQLLTGTYFTTGGTGLLRTRNTAAAAIPAGITWLMDVEYYNTVSQTIVAGNYTNLNGTGGNRVLPNGGTVGIAGSFTPGAGTYTITGSTVNFNGATAQAIPAFNYYNLSSSNTGDRSLSGTIGVNAVFNPGTGNTYTVTGSTIDFKSNSSQTIPAFNYNNLTSSSTGARVLANSGTIGVAGAFAFGTNTYTISGSTIDFNSSTAQTIPVFTYHNLTASNTATKTAAGDITVNSILNVGTGAVLDMVTNKVVGNALTTNGAGVLQTQHTGATAVPAGRTWSMDMLYNASGDQTIVAGNYRNLNGTGGNRTLPNGTVTGIAGTFTPGNGSYTITNSTLDFNGNNDQDIPAFTYNNMKVSGGYVKRMAGDAVILDSVKVAASTTLAVDTKTITLKSDAAKTARVGMVEGTITYGTGGKFAVQRYVPAKRSWRLVTAPLTNASSIYNAWQNNGVYEVGKGTLITGPGGNGLDNGNVSMKKFDAATQSLNAVTATNVSISGNSGNSDNQAYFLFVRGDRNPGTTNVSNSNNTTLSSTGRLQTGTQTFPAIANTGKYTLVGNPYASPVDFNNVDRVNLVKRFYVWDPALNQVGGYVVLDDLDDDGNFSKSVDGSAQDKDIQSGQAFYVQTMLSATASVTFNESSKSGMNNNHVFRPLNEKKESIKASLYLLNNDASVSLADGVLAEYDEHYSKAVSIEDAVKFSNTNENLSLLRNGTSLAVERLPVMDASPDTLFLKLATTSQRNYRFEFNAAHLDHPGMTGFIEDTYLSSVTPLNLDGITKVDFSITGAAASAATNRFRIVFRPSVVLPVTITSVRAIQQNDNIVVEWTTENELNIAAYAVERSVDGITFNTNGEITAKGSSGSNRYSWVDEQPVAGNNFYRIRSNDRSGEIKYSKVVKVMTGKMNPAISVYPNQVVNGNITVQMKNQPGGTYLIRLVNSNGQVAYSNELQHAADNEVESISLGSNLAKGIYMVEITTAGGNKTTLRVNN